MMALTQEELWHKEALQKLATGVFIGYQNMIDSILFHSSEVTLTDINKLNQLYVVENYYYYEILTKKERKNILKEMEEELHQKSAKEDFEAILSLETETLPLRRVRKKLKKMEREEEQKLPLNAALAQEMETSFLTFLEEELNNKNQKKEVRDILKRNRFYFIYLSDQEYQHMNNLFQYNRTGKIVDYIELLKKNYPSFEQEIVTKKEEYGKRLAQQALGKIFTFSDFTLQTGKMEQAEVVQRQQQLRASFLLLDKKDIDQSIQESILKQNNLKEKKEALTLIHTTVEKASSDKQKLFLNDNPRLQK